MGGAAQYRQRVDISHVDRTTQLRLSRLDASHLNAYLDALRHLADFELNFWVTAVDKLTSTPLSTAVRKPVASTEMV